MKIYKSKNKAKTQSKNNVRNVKKINKNSEACQISFFLSLVSVFSQHKTQMSIFSQKDKNILHKSKASY